MKRLLLLLHTLRYLQLKQLYYRILYRVRKPRLNGLPEPVMREFFSAWEGPAYLHPATEDGKAFRFLGEVGDLQNGWNNPTFSKLWLYNLHYQDYLHATGVEGRSALNRQLVEDWIAANPPLKGNGWEPYCLSLRIVNWVKWLSRLDTDTAEAYPHLLRSLACQANALEQQLEFHILANHLFANAKALVFVGSFLGGREGNVWLEKGLKLLDQEIPEQFLTDGGHFELSPMYHAILLWDMCDLLQLQQQTQLDALCKREAQWRRVIGRGINWLRSMVHPDGGIAFFNDATLGIAPTLRQLEAYADQLKALPATITEKADLALQLIYLHSSGYLVIDWPGQHRALLDAARVGPDYQPGHAHADTLSFELSLFGQRILVNSGISQYGEDAVRYHQRSTAAHNTLEVDGGNSSEVWLGFRVGRRAKPFDLDIHQQAQQVEVAASHDGYKRLRGSVIHRRHWTARPQELVIQDKLSGQFNQAKAFFHLHPDVQLERLDENIWRGRLPQGQFFELSFEGGAVELRSGSWQPGFGVSIPNVCLIVTLQASTLQACVSWSEN